MPTLEEMGLNEDIGRINRKYAKLNQGNPVIKRIGKLNSEIPGNTPKRAFYNFIRGSYPDKSVIISSSYLRCDVALATTGQVKFSVNESDGGNFPLTTKRLNQNDTFEVMSYGIYLWTTPAAAGVPTAKAQSRVLYTYPNERVFSSGAGVEAAALYGIYSGGTLVYKLGTTEVVSALDCMRFYRVPTSQEGTAVSAVALTGIVASDGWNSQDFGLSEDPPSFTMSGNGKNNWSLSLAEGDTLSPDPAANRINYVTLYIRGLLCSNGAKQTNRKMSA